MTKKRNTVHVTYKSNEIELDVNRIIAIDVTNKHLYFEFAVWHIESNEDFYNVYKAWKGDNE